MSRQSVISSLRSSFILVITLNCVTAKVISPSPWAGFSSKSVYSRSLGPPPISGFGTINVPYMPKASPFFPKFVDPKSMISKKTDMLSNLFGGVGGIPDGESPVSVPGSFLQFPSIEAQSNPVPKLQSSLPLMEERRSASLLADDPESSLKDTNASDKDETIVPDSSVNDSNKNSVESQTIEKEMSSNTVKEYLPGMIGPFAMDPSMFIEKKYSFLDTLFKNLATSTTPTPTTTEAIPKSTIVPAEFWIPNSAIPGPMEYNKKVSDFLDKLFDTLKSNMNSSVTPSGTRVARSVEDASSIIAAKDAIVETILSQLCILKDNMISVLNDTISYERGMSMNFPMIPKKPFLPSMWSKPTVDPMLPFQQKIAFLDQMFDALIELHKNISKNIEAALKSELNESNDSESSNLIDVPLTRADGIILNSSFIDAVAQSLAQRAMYPTITSKGATKRVARASPSATSFWVAYPEDTHTVAKRHALPNYYNYPRDKSDVKQSTELLQKYDKEDNDVSYNTQGQREKIDQLKKYIDRMEYFLNEPKEHRHHHRHY